MTIRRMWAVAMMSFCLWSQKSCVTMGIGSVGNARFPLGPSALAFALYSGGSILNTTGPAASRSFAEWTFQLKRDLVGGFAREPNGSLPQFPVCSRTEVSVQG